MPDDVANKIMIDMTKNMFGIQNELENCFPESGEKLTNVANKLKDDDIVSTIKAVKELAWILRGVDLT